MKSEDVVGKMLQESPQLVPATSFGLNDPPQAAKFVNDLIRKKRGLFVGEIYGTQLFKSGNIFYAIDEVGLAYFVQLETGKFSALGIPHATQIAIWRRNGAPNGLARKIFWDFVYPIHKTIISDNQQTDDGSRFWGDRIREVFEFDLPSFVYAVQLQPRNLHRIESKTDFAKYLHLVYGTTGKFKVWRLVLTDHNLNAKVTPFPNE